MIDLVRPRAGERALDIAAGTGSMTRLVAGAGAGVVSVDQSPGMLSVAVGRGATGVVAPAERLPFPDGVFDLVTFGYLLRYVDDVEGAMTEVGRVLKGGGRAGMVEFGRPNGIWRPPWWVYTRMGLPLAGLVAGPGWARVGRFLGPSIDGFADRFPPRELVRVWERAGFEDVRLELMSLGGGLVMSGLKT